MLLFRPFVNPEEYGVGAFFNPGKKQSSYFREVKTPVTEKRLFEAPGVTF